MSVESMHPVIQYPDLTELCYLSSPNLAPFDLTGIQTEFAFWVSAPYAASDMARKRAVDKLNFVHVSSMNNWWGSHCTKERELQVFWWKNTKKPAIVPIAHRQYWGSHVPLCASGCGMRLSEPPVERKLHFQYLTLLRMPIRPMLAQREELKELHFRCIAVGSLASFWVNGWTPEEYSVKREFEFFNTTHSKWCAQNGYLDY